ncbi:MAG TPA: RNA polymerase sigma factor [Pyrinomonadaceae bacterium]|jgi:RNA polymerase sigma-70 factor (ECF subfamily)|nr:RNA polymerase sigma factor [Pyrinomonadaceae bacterium]
MNGAASLQLLQGEAFVPAQDDSGAAARAADVALARRVAGGDEAAFEEVYRIHHRRVYGLCLRMTQNVAEAEDITQEVFILLHRKAGSFRGESQFNTWLYRLTVNQVLMRFRKSKARREDALDGVEARPGETFGAGRPNTSQLADRIALDSALAQLPPGYRAAFILHDVEGYEHEEVAQILGCAVGTSKSQLHKARVKLRKILARRP